MNGAELRRALREGRHVFGTCVVSTSPVWPAMIAQTGLDFVFIDTEHIPIDRAQLSWMCQTFAAKGLPPIVRIPKPDPYVACMALDAGANGLVAPYMETVEEVHKLRGAVKYRPLKGQTLYDALDDITTLPAETLQYLQHNNRNNICIVNIESTHAIANLDNMLAVPDVDALLIGPHDLSISLGVPEQYEHPTFSRAIKTIIEKGRAAGVGVGYHFSFGIDIAIAWAEWGANFVIHASDYFITRDALKSDIARFRETLRQPPVASPQTTQDEMTTI